MPPFPPSSHTFETANSQFLLSQNSLIKPTSASVSLTKLFRVTTTGTPKSFIFSICFSRFTIPFFRASRFSFDKSSLATPPLYLRALTVATITTQSGVRPAFLHFISKNFSAPRSAPNPASVSAISAIPIAIFVALIELHPCAIFAKGPP